MRRALKTLLKLLAGAAIAALVAFAASFVVVLVTSQRDDRDPVDAIVVLGAAQYNGRPSPVLQARLDHALRLYKAKLAPRVVVTGGQATGDRESEATVGRRYLASRGIPPTRIVLRPEGRSTRASVEAVAYWARKEGHDTLLFVSDPFHLARVLAEARHAGVVARVSPTQTSPISDNPRLELEYLVAEAVKLPVAWASGVVEARVRKP